MEQRTKCVLPGRGGSPRARAATGRLTNIARKLCGASKRSSANFATFSLVCEWQRTKPSSISLWRSVARGPGRPHRPTALIHHRRPRAKIFRFENARAVHLGGRPDSHAPVQTLFECTENIVRLDLLTETLGPRS